MFGKTEIWQNWMGSYIGNMVKDTNLSQSKPGMGHPVLLREK